MHVTARGQPASSGIVHLSFGDRLLLLDLSHEEGEAGWLESPEPRGDLAKPPQHKDCMSVPPCLNFP